MCIKERTVYAKCRHSQYSEIVECNKRDCKYKGDKAKVKHKEAIYGRKCEKCVKDEKQTAAWNKVDKAKREYRRAKEELKEAEQKREEATQKSLKLSKKMADAMAEAEFISASGPVEQEDFAYDEQPVMAVPKQTKGRKGRQSHTKHRVREDLNLTLKIISPNSTYCKKRMMIHPLIIMHARHLGLVVHVQYRARGRVAPERSPRREEVPQRLPTGMVEAPGDEVIQRQLEEETRRTQLEEEMRRTQLEEGYRAYRAPR